MCESTRFKLAFQLGLFKIKLLLLSFLESYVLMGTSIPGPSWNSNMNLLSEAYCFTFISTAVTCGSTCCVASVMCEVVFAVTPQCTCSIIHKAKNSEYNGYQYF